MRILVFSIFLLFSISAAAEDFGNAFWVWHRSYKLNETEETTLKAGGVKRIFWHAGSWDWNAGKPGFGGGGLPRKPGDPDLEVVPVIRLAADASQVETAEARAALIQFVENFIQKHGPSALQIDYDCPDRLLPEYQQLLSAVRDEIAPRELSVTTLAGWVKLEVFAEFTTSVDWLAPMFYDLWTDQSEDVQAGKIRPLADPESDELIKAWSACPIPWEAGLPNFARVTLFRENGLSRGHFPDWPWDLICFNPGLEIVSEPSPGITLLRARGAQVIQNVKVEEGDLLATKIPSRKQLEVQRRLALESGARGVIWFRLPGATVPTGLSAADVLALGSDQQLQVSLKFDGANFVLANNGKRDLVTRIIGKHGEDDRGYQLEIDAGEKARFAEVSGGDFVLMRGHIEPEADEPKPVGVQAATRLTFWLSHLPAGGEIYSGFVQLKPGSQLTDLRWRLDGGEWSEFESE
ncbi:MAG: DUF3142 domain-containing protein [Verrucomicrobiota bacterium]